MRDNIPPMARPENPWDLRMGWFWYNDEEIFQDRDADLERKAKSVADNGINLVCTFSCTHFRWSFMSYWEQLNDVLARIVAAFHNQGIQVVEHHSAILVHGSQGDEGVRWFEGALTKRHSSISSWPEWCGTVDTRDPMVVDGQRLSSFYQVSGETGDILDASYSGYMICVNNPNYIRTYLKYLESVYATGVDGIMTDDVGFSWLGCVCEHCRSKFKNLSGYDIPISGEEWKKWRDDLENPEFREFVDFKRKSVEDFHVAVKKHYENLGLRLLRPNYHSHCFHSYKNGYCMQKLPALDFVFQEAGGAHIMEYSWPKWGPEVAHRYSVGRFRDIPSLLMTYPTRDSNLALSWSLAMSWGQLYTWTTELFEPPKTEKMLREFEKKHRNLLLKPIKFSRLGFYDSHRSRELNLDYVDETRPQFMSWMMACGMSSVPYDVFSTEELTERLACYDLIVLIGVKHLSGWELSEFRRFLERGGVIVWTGTTGRFDCSRAPWSISAIAEALNCPNFAFPESDDEILNHSAGEKGSLLTCGADSLVAECESEYQIDWWSRDITKETTIPFKRLSRQDIQVRKDIVALLERYISDGFDLLCDNLPDGVLATAFLNADQNAVVIHLVNASGILDKPDGAPLSYFDDDSVPFPSHSESPDFNLALLPPDRECFRNIKDLKVRYHSLDGEKPLELNADERDGRIHISIPSSLLQVYALIEIK